MTGFIMAYPDTTSANVGEATGGFLPDNRFGRMYQMNVGTTVGNGLRLSDIYPNGAEVRDRNVTDLGTLGLISVWCCTYNSQELVCAASDSNSTEIDGYAMYDLSHSSTFGSISSNLMPSTQTRILAPARMCSFHYSGRDLVVTVSEEPNPAEINCINWSLKLNTPTTIAEAYAVCGSVPDGSGSAAAVWGYSGDNSDMSLYVMNAAASLNKIASIAPTTIDSTWTNVTHVYGITVDQTDGNIILGFSTSDSVTNSAYLVKFNFSSGALMWKVALGTHGVGYGENDMARNWIANGTLYYFDNYTAHLMVINTATGAATTVATLTNSLTLDTLYGHQISEDISFLNSNGTISGSLMWMGEWEDNVSYNPTYVGAYAPSNHSWSGMVGRIWPETTGAPQQPGYAIPAASRKRAWSFVLDGHTFYVLDLGTQGTFIYDKDTSQWAQFITQGYVQWNFANGTMWGQRIVAGDLLTTELWEMQPGELFDNGATEIQHVVTGGVALRNRIYRSCDMFRLACSSGQFTDTTGAGSVTLSFSDDQGQTWVTMDTFALTEGNYTQEFIWSSLGSFASPGRIFKITDSGGFLRIDGADAGIDGFDSPTEAQSGPQNPQQ